MILMPSQSDKECIPSNQVWLCCNNSLHISLQLSSIGFVGFILSVVNAAMNIVNNANSNNNDRNNNNNDNNDNNDNINIANLNSGQMNMQMVMAGRSLWTRLKHLLRVKRDKKECQARTGTGEVVAMVGLAFLDMWGKVGRLDEEICIHNVVCQVSISISKHDDCYDSILNLES